MDFVGSGGGGGGGTSLGGGFDGASLVSNGAASGGGGGGNGGMGAENGPILYTEPNRTSAIDDIRSVVIYIFIITIFLSFFLILPGIRNDKFPTFLCITTSLIVTSIILISLFGTTWHVAEAPISAAYKAFSRDRIQGDLSVRIGLQSVNITLRAQKYYILHETRGPMIMFNSPAALAANQQQPQESLSSLGDKLSLLDSADHESLNSESSAIDAGDSPGNLGDELLRGRTADGAPVDTELEVDEVFASPPASRLARASPAVASTSPLSNSSISSSIDIGPDRRQQPSMMRSTTKKRDIGGGSSMSVGGQRYTIKRVDVDINYNERFYWIEPNQMHQEHQKALERGLPYPILTVVEYLSQDDGGFNWSRQYRSAGYYSYIILWLSLCVCALMFFLHCAAPKYGIYTMQLLGALLLFANLTYATLVPRGDQKLVIPFEGQSLTFRFGWSFWLVLIGGCLSLLVGTIIVIIDCIFPNFILTTVLDVDYDSHYRYYQHKRRQKSPTKCMSGAGDRPTKPAFLENSSASAMSRNSPLRLEFNSGNNHRESIDDQNHTTTTTTKQQDNHHDDDDGGNHASLKPLNSANNDCDTTDDPTTRHRFLRAAGESTGSPPLSRFAASSAGRPASGKKLARPPIEGLFGVGGSSSASFAKQHQEVDVFVQRPSKQRTTSTSEIERQQQQPANSSVVEIFEDDVINKSDSVRASMSSSQQHHHHHQLRHNQLAKSSRNVPLANGSHKNNNLKNTDHQSRQRQSQQQQQQQAQPSPSPPPQEEQSSSMIESQRLGHNARL